MPVEFASASVNEPAEKGDFVIIDETGLSVADARQRLDQAELGSASRALRTVGTYVFLRTLMRTMERTGATAEMLELKKTMESWRLQETMRVCEAYRAADKADDPHARSPHRIDLIT